VPPFNPIPFPPTRPPIQPRTQAEQAAWYTQPAQGVDYTGYTEVDYAGAQAAAMEAAQAQYAFRMPEDTVAMASSTAATDYAEALAKVAYADPTSPPPIAGRTEGGGTWELPSPQFASLDDFLSKNTGRGVLTLQALVDESGTPVQGANIKVTKNIGGVTYQFYDVQTDANGSAGQLPLPAPEKQLSTMPPQSAAPYALYDVTVTYRGTPQTLQNVVIFADTESMQSVQPGETEPINEIRYTM